ncbi:hypothetical protein GCM10018781_44540 [Kitasatospora indigofera]|uniref:Uncharacterized protein n=1 Tax=Kitasatospora indigofera TaxID=67307 RepID=A0A919KWY6_9ACTN|nr:hypothetical protein GCM10018781_44540 [Kitasatospora indigofera]
MLAQLGARRAGGWRVVRRRLRREAAATAAAFAAPVRAQLRYRRHLRLLLRLLGDRSGWADAERAALGAGRVPGVQPYGVLLGRTVVGVLVACGPAAPPQPPKPWAADDTDPRLWWLDRADAARVATGGRPAPLLAAFGTDGRHAVLLDLATGPAVTVLGGDKGTARAVLQALAAQLDARLPAGAVTVADGVNPRHTGPEPAAALALAERAATGGAPAFAVCAELPAGARPAAGSRLLALSGARGSARLLTADRAGLSVLGTGLRVDAVPLARATARSLPLLPPYPAHDAGPTDDSDLSEPALDAEGPGGPGAAAGPGGPVAIERPAPAGLPGRSALGATVAGATVAGPTPAGGSTGPSAGPLAGPAAVRGTRPDAARPATGEPVGPRPGSAELPGRSALAPPHPDGPVPAEPVSAEPVPDGPTPDESVPGRPTPGRPEPGRAVDPVTTAVGPTAPAAPAAPEPEPEPEPGPPPLVLGPVIVPGRATPPGAPRPTGLTPPARPRFVQRPGPPAGDGPAPGPVQPAPVAPGPVLPDPATRYPLVPGRAATGPVLSGPARAAAPATGTGLRPPGAAAAPATPGSPDPAGPITASPAGPITAPPAGGAPAAPGVRGRLRLPAPPAAPQGDQDTFGPVRVPGGPEAGRSGPAPAAGGPDVLTAALAAPPLVPVLAAVPAPPAARIGVPAAQLPVDDDLAEPEPDPGSGPPGVSAAVPN